MSTKWIELSLFISVLLSGFYGGTGFFVAMGGNPALRNMSAAGFAEYWQYIDRYMGARMPVFGPTLLLSLLVSVVVLAVSKQQVAMWLTLASLLIIVADLIFTLNINHPLNKYIQSWDLNNLPADVELVKHQVIRAFNARLVMMIASFFFSLAALWFVRRP